jgi:hypothetical protein
MERTLTDLGVEGETMDLFLRLKSFTLTTQMALVLALTQMKDVKGRSQVLDTAVTLDTVDQACFLARSLGMLAHEHATTPLKEIVDGRPIGVTREGRVMVCAAVDYVSWTRRTAEFASRQDLVSRKPVLKVCGALSPTARKEFEVRGWEVVETTPPVDLY